MSIYNEDEMVAPAWINQEFLENVLKQYEKSGNIELQILEFDLTPASMKGDHYASIMFRCKVDYKLGDCVNQKSLIIKTMPMEEGMKREMLSETKLFETEIEMFSKTLPKIEKILAQYGEATRLSAELIYHALEPHKVLIFEDLCKSGYDVVRNRYLSEYEIKAVYRKVAKLHAVSYMLGLSENHEEVTKYQDGVFTIPMASEMMTNGLDNFEKMLRHYDEFHIYLDKFEALKPDIIKASEDLYKVYELNNNGHQKEDILVLNHGDFHMKNLMFKFNDSADLEDVIMVDYQISCYAPSLADMLYSQYMMLSAELRLKRHELMQCYFAEFIRILKKINYQGVMPKYSDFQIAALKYRHFTLLMVSTCLPMVTGVLGKTVEELKDTDVSEFIEKPDKINEIYRTPAYVNEMRKFLPILLSEGYFD